MNRKVEKRTFLLYKKAPAYNEVSKNRGGTSVRSLQIKKQILAFFMPGFLLGILYANFFLKQSMLEVNIFDLDILKKYAETGTFGTAYFLYIIQIRMAPFLLLMALAFTKIKKALMPMTVVWCAFSGGTLLTVAILKMGMKGIVLCIACVVPQIICYVVAYLIVLIYCMQYPRSQWNRQKTMFVILMMVSGILIEAYLTPIIVKSFLRQW